MAHRMNNLIGHLAAAPTGAERRGVATQNTSAMSTGGIGSKGNDDVVIVSALRTPIGRARKGAFKETTPDDLLKAVLEGVVQQSGINPAVVGDVVVGNCQMGGSYAGPARMAQLRAGFPVTVPINAVNRQCSSGLQAVANIAGAIKAGIIDCGIGCGVESMTHGGGVADASAPPPMNLNEVFTNPLAAQCLTPMGSTAETVAERYGVTREKQDAMGVESHRRALLAQKNGWFDAEIVKVPVTVEDADGNESTVMISKDDGPRETTLAGLAKLKTVFKKEGGTVTAGTSSQVSDGAAAVLLMSRARARELGVKPIGVFRSYKVVGCNPDEMGIGPAVAIPPALAAAGLRTDQIDCFEINEAFAAQAVYCCEKLGVDMNKTNPVGGAIALGHPLGCTGSRQIATLLNYLHRTGGKTGVVSMCIGTGMGAAAVIEAE